MKEESKSNHLWKSTIKADSHTTSLPPTVLIKESREVEENFVYQTDIESKHNIKKKKGLKMDKIFAFFRSPVVTPNDRSQVFSSDTTLSLPGRLSASPKSSQIDLHSLCAVSQGLRTSVAMRSSSSPMEFSMERERISNPDSALVAERSIFRSATANRRTKPMLMEKTRFASQRSLFSLLQSPLDPFENPNARLSLGLQSFAVQQDNQKSIATPTKFDRKIIRKLNLANDSSSSIHHVFQSFHIGRQKHKVSELESTTTEPNSLGSTRENSAGKKIRKKIHVKRNLPGAKKYDSIQFETKMTQIVDHTPIQNRQIYETSRVYSKKETKNTVISPTGKNLVSVGKVNQYHMFEDLGKGSFGKVVLALDEISLIYFACKIISKSRLMKKFRFTPGGEEVIMEKIKREVAILKKVSDHPNINKLYEVLDDRNDEYLYLCNIELTTVFELCEKGPIMTMHLGMTVTHFDDKKSKDYFRGIVLGLEFLHFQRIIHCDIKPENIFLRADDCVQIGDFGISTFLDEREMIANQTASPLFAAPCSVMELDKIKGKATDIWALGVTLFCFLHGRCPFEDDDILALNEKIIYDQPIYDIGLDSQLKHLLDCMMNKNARKRITIEKIKLQPWVTDGGTRAMLSTKENCIGSILSLEDLKGAVTQASKYSLH